MEIEEDGRLARDAKAAAQSTPQCGTLLGHLARTMTSIGKIWPKFCHCQDQVELCFFMPRPDSSQSGYSIPVAARNRSGVPAGTFMTSKPFFRTVTMIERMKSKSSAPCRVRKHPEIFTATRRT